MKIGIDVRMAGPNVGGGGLGRYVQQLVKELPGVDSKNRYVLFGNEVNIPWYTLKEQIFLPTHIDKHHLDLVHFPHWNVPVFLKTPFVVTIHDLILLHEPRSARATTLHPILYAIKYRGFRSVLSHAINASKKIITVSQATKTDILKFFPHIDPNKIVVIYEGVTPLSPSVLPCQAEPGPASPDLPLSPFPSLLYVGNCYPHKNLETLLNAFDLLRKTNPDVRLIFAGRSDEFSKRLKDTASKRASGQRIEFRSNPTDEDLAQIYANATVYVFPSVIEGFGLPPLEAMSLDVPVAASDIPSLREILGASARYFPPNDPEAIARILQHLLEQKPLRDDLIEKGREQIKQYSWKKMAEQTLCVYESCANQKTP